jgi:hypothetical protein
MCSAEARSGLTLRRDMPALTEWVQSRMTTPEGAAVYASLRDLPIGDRGGHLRSAAGARGIGGCAAAAAYDDLAVAARDRGELQHLCSRIDLPPMDDLDEPSRLQLLEEWIDARTVGARAKQLGVRLPDAAPGPDRAGVLAAAARELGILSCETARTLEQPATRGTWPAPAR